MVAFLVQSLILLLASHVSSTSSSTPAASSTDASAPVYNSPSGLQLTAIVGQNNQSTFQCWQLQPNFQYPTQPGIRGSKLQQLGDFSSASLVMFSPSNTTYAGIHNAPSPQLVVFLSGGGYVRLSERGQRLPIVRGDIVIANDTAPVSAIGHDSVWFPGTVAMQLPFASGRINHTVISNGPCEHSN